MHSSVSNALKTCLAVVSLFVSNVPSISAPVPTVEIAVSRELLDNTFINRTLDALSDSLARNQVTLQVRAANVLEIEELVRNDQIDLFIAPSTLYRRLLLSGCSDIAATHETRTHNPNRAEAYCFSTVLTPIPQMCLTRVPPCGWVQTMKPKLLPSAGNCSSME